MSTGSRKTVMRFVTVHDMTMDLTKFVAQEDKKFIIQFPGLLQEITGNGSPSVLEVSDNHWLI